MIRFVSMILFALALPVLSYAQGHFDHNGSTMKLERSGSTISIYYDRPRKGLLGVGIRPGSLLFRGRLDSSNYLEGKSRIFSRQCGEIDYFVYGDFSVNQRFVLRGAAPVLSKGTCKIVDNTYDGSNANLVFTPITTGKAPSTRQTTSPSGDESCVTNVRAGSTLNMRAGPSTRYGIVAEIPWNSCDVLLGESCIGNWCGIRHRENVGWVNTKFLKRR